MKAQGMMVAAGLLILTGCQSMGGGGESMPTITRTGAVKDIIIREDISPATLTVNPGDEIRWINKRQGSARVVFLDPVMDTLSCQRNFGSWMGANRQQYTATLSTNDTASVCFRSGGQIKYVVRADSATVPSGELNIPGTISVAGGGTGEDRAMQEMSGNRASEPVPSAEQNLGSEPATR
jgi:plastocyanin